MAIFDVYRNRRAVQDFDPTKHHLIPRADMQLALWQAWKCTPGKNNFMPYNVFAIGPNRQDYKNLVFENCLANEGRASGLDVAAKYSTPGTVPPFFSNIKTCSWLLMYTLRLEDKLNPYQKNAIERGQNFEYATRAGMFKSQSSIAIEVGMFCDLVGGLCLEQGWDVSQVLCFSRNLETWADLPFIKDTPLLLQPVGIGLNYKPTWSGNRRPNFPRIVKFVE
jgi:hypothetical protein